ncbi:DUF309 domain-containing protein [Pseudonocardia sp. KRD291]|uniref:DUF309 domain-containing protein n=1 Tax=Pseudonocardia sp. KRD291 TaxID=2792007 RepID=UPI001C4A0F1C|nr:DUF309 domain-containing protein [Pseudonocardia sp. KRD291]MBW0105077.1 DUF309 domain-containing protein [Pseudonocardia sp. KRD291]
MSSAPRRDRDEQGRARNSRPRDAAGRPLPHDADGVERVPEDLVLTPEETVTEAQRLLDGGLPFQAHEVLEGAWKASEAPTRELWRAMAQLAVGLTHAQRSNARGAVSLLRRGAEGIEEWQTTAAAPVPAGLDLAGLRRHAVAVADQVERDSVTAVSPADLAPTLRGHPERPHHP